MAPALIVVCAALASCSPPGTDGIVIASSEALEEVRPLGALGDTPIEITLPHIPVVALPDLSAFGQYDDLLDDRLGQFALEPVDGVEVVAAECGDGEAILAGNETSNIFDTDQIGNESFAFEIDEATGASSYEHQAGETRTVLETEPDGSGIFVEESAYSRLSIEAAADGSGRYYSEQPTITTSVEVGEDGSGVYYQQQPDSLTTITLGTDNSGALFSESPSQLLTVDAHSDGSGDLYLKQGARIVTLRIRADGSWELTDTSDRVGVTVKVGVDGRGDYRQRGDLGTVSLNFDADGNSSWRGTPGPQIILPPAPQFAVADRFPALGTLATLQPPCGDGSTTLRFDSQVLFAVNEAVVLPQAAAILAEVAPALIEAGRSLEINGHTDANGTDAYNQALSEERAQAVADELQSLGVDVELTINGLGETQPVAENYNADGSDNEAGQRQNRRVEIVIRG